MADHWDDSDDDWDRDDDELDARLGLKKADNDTPAAAFDAEDEEDLTLKEKAAEHSKNHAELKKKGTVLAARKAAEKAREEELEIAKKAMEIQLEAEASMTPGELKALRQRQIEEADDENIQALFGGGGEENNAGAAAAVPKAGGKLVLKDAVANLKHARLVAESFKDHGKVHLATAFVKELLEQSKSLLDDNAITDIIKTCNVIKNEKVQEAKRKQKGQAQKSKKVDKAAVAKAKEIEKETFGDNDEYDAIDEMGAAYEDSFF